MILRSPHLFQNIGQRKICLLAEKNSFPKQKKDLFLGNKEKIPGPGNYIIPRDLPKKPLTFGSKHIDISNKEQEKTPSPGDYSPQFNMRYSKSPQYK